MPIIACGECAGKVSTLATSCPHCGAPVAPSVRPAAPEVSKPVPHVPIVSKPVPQGPIIPMPSPAAVNRIVAFRVIGVLLILAGVGLGVQMVFFPTAEQLGQIGQGVVGGGPARTQSSLATFLIFMGVLAWRFGK